MAITFGDRLIDSGYHDITPEQEREIEFDNWIEALEIEVIQGEYGYEPGEFNVTPENWRPLFDEGLSPLAAFKRALDAHCEARKSPSPAEDIGAE